MTRSALFGFILWAAVTAWPNSVTASDIDDCNSSKAPLNADLERAAAACRRLAEQGLAAAQDLLGVMYMYGRGVPTDNHEAVKWFSKAAKQGLASAQNNLGSMYDSGLGVSQNYDEALKWFTIAADQGLTDAMISLGDLYADVIPKGGLDRPQDFKKAVMWYRKAAEQGDHHAYYLLGFMYRMGYGVPRDLVQSYAWYSLAAATDETGMSGIAISERDKYAKMLTPDQIEKGEKLAAEWKPKPKQP